MSGRVLDLRQRNVASVAAESADLRGVGVRLAKLTKLAPEGVWVELESGAAALARVCIDWDAQRLAEAVAQGSSAVLAFEDGDVEKPLLLGIVRSQLRAEPECVERAAELQIDAEADGRRVRLTAREEIVLQCGESSITLKHNGRVIIRGAYVETHASGTNRIKGGNVRIN